jgi:hypothetical protein
MKKIMLRAYTKTKNKYTNFNYNHPNINRVFVFDTETTTDIYQNLKIGFFQVYQDNILVKEGLFYDPSLSYEDIKVLEKSKKTFKTLLYTFEEFIKILYTEVYYKGSLCIGYNLAFDISRISKDYGYSRKNNKGGFTFILSDNKKYPPIIIKKIGDAYTFKFQRSISNKGNNYFSGYFLDVLKFSEVLLEKKHISLLQSCKILNTKNKKLEDIEHGKINTKYIEYLMKDVISTYEVYLKLLELFKKYNIDIPINKIYSSASLGKYLLNQLGIKPFNICNPNFNHLLLGKIMTSYYGGRCECNYRNKPILTDTLDFTSMYPTITILYDLWKYIIAKEIITEDVTEEIKELINSIDLKKLKNKEIYKNFNVLVKIKPNNDFLPIRTDYKGDNKTNNLGLNYLTSNKEIWYSLPDIISSKIYTNKSPEIIKAIRFIPKGIQEGLKKSKIVNINVDPERNNLIKIFVEERQKIKEKMKSLNKDTSEYNLCNSEQKALKILVNAFSYGIFIELNKKEAKKNIKVNGLEAFNSSSNFIETEGKFFNPILGTIITSGARLFLTIAQKIAEDNGYKHYYMDTDSIFVSPKVSDIIINYFNNLNPYDANIPLLKKEKENVYFYGICSKRYCIYTKEGIIDYKLHGLGHLINPYSSKIEVWHKEIWGNVIHYVIHSKNLCNTLHVLHNMVFDKYSNFYALSKITISSPNIIKRFNKMNKDKDYYNKIKPFNFCLVGFSTKDNVKPIIPFSKDSQKMVYEDFIDYETGEVINGVVYWKPLAHTISAFYDHPENKFDGYVGYLKRKHIICNDIQYIGKEANNIDEEVIKVVNPINYKNNDEFKKDLEELSNKELCNKYGFRYRSHIRYWKDNIKY